MDDIFLCLRVPVHLCFWREKKCVMEKVENEWSLTELIDFDITGVENWCENSSML